MKRNVIKVRWNDKDSAMLLVEQLRYAGLITKEGENAFTILPPKGVSSDVWALQNAKRMRSFGIIAESVEAKF